MTYLTLILSMFLPALASDAASASESKDVSSVSELLEAPPAVSREAEVGEHLDACWEWDLRVSTSWELVPDAGVDAAYGICEAIQLKIDEAEDLYNLALAQAETPKP